MSDHILYTIPNNEIALQYQPESKERASTLEYLANLEKEYHKIPLRIGSDSIYTEEKGYIKPPHAHNNTIGEFTLANQNQVDEAIESSIATQKNWSETPFEIRAKIFLKAAELFSTKYRSKIVASTMLGQSKSIQQSETDAACQLIDYLRFSVYYAQEIFKIQPQSNENIKNTLEYRPLEGFVYAITPFNFTSIAMNLWAAPVLMGNTCIWKPSDYQVLSANIIAEVFEEAGLPSGVLNVIYGDPNMISNTIFNHKDFAGLHFTGSTSVFKRLWRTIGENISRHKSYPKIIGETGGKGFILADDSANPQAVVAAIIRGAFEFQGQKCSAASRCYISETLWKGIKQQLIKEVKTINIGPPNDTKNFVNAVIHEQAFDKIVTYIEHAKQNEACEIISGGKYDKTTGYFIEPTIIVTQDPLYKSMTEEIFGPIVTIYIYEDNKYNEVLEIIDKSTIYGLTGAIFSQNNENIKTASEKLINTAGNFYINDKPTGGVIGQQPFGGSRGSGTNDKAGSIFNLIQWTSPRTIKEVFLPETNYRYPFLKI